MCTFISNDLKVCKILPSLYVTADIGGRFHSPKSDIGFFMKKCSALCAVHYSSALETLYSTSLITFWLSGMLGPIRRTTFQRSGFWLAHDQLYQITEKVSSLITSTVSIRLIFWFWDQMEKSREEVVLDNCADSLRSENCLVNPSSNNVFCQSSNVTNNPSTSNYSITIKIVNPSLNNYLVNPSAHYYFLTVTTTVLRGIFRQQKCIF